MAFSPDGKRLASASRDETVKVWDAATGQETLTLKGHTGGVTSVAFSPDGKRLASASEDETVKVWDAATGQETLTLKGHTGCVTSVAFSPDGKRLASASDDGTVKVWDAATGQETLTLKGHTDAVTSVAFSPDGQRLASASSDGTVKVWDARPLDAEPAKPGPTLTLREPRSQTSNCDPWMAGIPTAMPNARARRLFPFRSAPSYADDTATPLALARVRFLYSSNNLGGHDAPPSSPTRADRSSSPWPPPRPRRRSPPPRSPTTSTS